MQSMLHFTCTTVTRQLKVSPWLARMPMGLLSIVMLPQAVAVSLSFCFYTVLFTRVIAKHNNMQFPPTCVSEAPSPESAAPGLGV